MNWLLEGLENALNMLWIMFWPLVLGLSISAYMQAGVSRDRMQQAFGGTGLKPVLLATGFGAASSSCSYAAVATARTVFQRGAGLVPMLAFMFAATNIVIELGILLWQWMGWEFVVAEIFGGVLMIFIMWGLVSLTKPGGLEAAARQHLEAHGGQGHAHEHHHHDHAHSNGDANAGQGKGVRIARAFFMDVQMLWKEVLVGVLIAGFLSTLVPQEWWQTLFLNPGSKWVQLLENVLVGPLIAVASFVCSDGNVPLANLLWSNGISFGGVVAFIYGDLLIIPLLLLYRKSFGAKTAIYITFWLYISMVLASLLVDLIFNGLGWIPSAPHSSKTIFAHAFAWNPTAWLNIAAAGLVVGLGMLKFKKAGAEMKP